jgi:hypothetical protein
MREIEETCNRMIMSLLKEGIGEGANIGSLE